MANFKELRTLKLIESGYRKDIDGLRAIAVLLVTFFHINEELIPGGYVGVDMFFVISGYLITGNIVRDYRAGRFTFKDFYRRRVRRILPAMFAVTFTTVVVGAAILLPSDVVQLAWSALATALSGANIFFTYFLDTSYFAADSATIPLLHMWSLGVEEQFYILWPLFLLVVLRLSTAKTIAAIATLIVASIAIGEWQLRTGEVEWAHYMLPSRAFQLAAGGALVFLPSLSRSASTALAPVGLVLVIGSAFLLDGASQFPGLWAIPVTFGTAMILAAGANSTAFSSLLSIKPLTAIGLVSYSLYLWHWPVLTFQRYFYGDLDPVQQVMSFIAMLGLATASYFFVEVPFRAYNASFSIVFKRFAILPSAGLAGLVAILVLTDGYGPYRFTDYPERLSSVSEAKPPYSLEYVCQRPRLRSSDISNDNCVIGTGAPRILLYGDSNAAHYVGVVGALAKAAGVSFRNYAHSACLPLGNRDPTAYVSARRLDTCLASHASVAADKTPYDIIFLGASWNNYAAAGRRNGANLAADLRSYITDLVSTGAHVVLLDTVPPQSKLDARCGLKMLKLAVRNCAAEGAADNRPPFTKTLQELAASIPRTTFVSVRDSLCQFGRCSAFDADGTSLYFDTSHMSAEGSWRVGQRYAETTEGAAVVQLLKSVID